MLSPTPSVHPPLPFRPPPLPCSMSVTGLYVFLPLFFQYVQQKSAADSGIQMIPMMLSLPVAAAITGAYCLVSPSPLLQVVF